MRAICRIAAFVACIAMIGSAAAADRDRRLDEIESKKDERKKLETLTAESTGKQPLLEEAVDPDRYVLGPGDLLLVNLAGPESRSFSIAVLPEGDVFLPGVGAIRADGLSLSEFRSHLADEVARYFQNIRLYCYLRVPRVFRVFVTGEVDNPGPARVSAVERVSDAIARVGDINEKGSLRLVTLERDGERITADLLKFLLMGDYDNNPFLRNGDRIHVPVSGIHATITGEVKREAYYEIVPGETLKDMVGLAGGFTTLARTDSVIVSRKDERGVVTTWRVPESMFGMELRDRDEISVARKAEVLDHVFVYGAVGRTGRFDISKGEGLTELLVRAGRLQRDVVYDKATLKRRSGELIRLDLRDYLPPDPSKELELSSGDIIDIPSVYQFVAVGGQVQEPGKFQYRNNLTVAHYIGLAGGPMKDGSIDRVIICSPDGCTRKGRSDSYPERGDVIIVKRGKWRIFGDFLGGVIRLGTVVITIIVLTK